MNNYSQDKLAEMALRGKQLTNDMWLSDGMRIFTIAQYRDGEWKLVMEEELSEPTDEDLANGYDEDAFEDDDAARAFGLVSVTPRGDRSEILPEDQLRSIFLEHIQTQNREYEAGDAGFREYVVYQRGVGI